MSNENKDRQRQDKIEARDIVVGASRRRIREEEPQKPKGKFALWLENYWYYYKFHTLVGLFIIFVVTVCCVQCATKETGDLTVTFAGSYTFQGEEREAFMDAINAVSPKDEKSGDRLTVSLSSYSIYNEEELKKLYTNPETGVRDDAGYNMAKGYNLEQLEAFGTFLKTGESPVLFVSEFVFDQRKLSELCVPLSELYGENIPASACSEYAIRLGDTEFYQYYAAVQVLPADTLLVLAKPFYMGATSNKEVYARYEQLFRNIVDFKMP